MTILLRRNAERDMWYSVHGMSIKEGEIVALKKLTNEDSSKDYPAEVDVIRSKSENDDYPYHASLNCFDYAGSI